MTYLFEDVITFSIYRSIYSISLIENNGIKALQQLLNDSRVCGFYSHQMQIISI